jgi:hypothetical protein
MKYLANQISDTVGSPTEVVAYLDQSFLNTGIGPVTQITHEDQELLSEEEEEEEVSESDAEPKNSESKTGQAAIGSHLADGEDQVAANVPQIFSGSADEWTDQRIKEF